MNWFGLEGVELRENDYSPEPEWAGKAEALRMPLQTAVPGILYKWVADEGGTIWILPHQLDFKHSSLVLEGALVYCAGLLRVVDKQVNWNCASGHYMTEHPLLFEAEILSVKRAMEASVCDCGFEPGTWDPGFEQIP